MKSSVLAFALLLASLAAFAAPTAAENPVQVVLQGPTAIAPSSVRLYAVTVTGGPAEGANGTFTIEYTLQGDNLVGADPQIPRTLANKEGVFSFNVTAPGAEGTVTLYVKATSTLESRNVTAEGRLQIEVVSPVEFRATLRNNGAAAAVNVTVLFYLDGRLIGNATVARIDAGGTADVNLTYIPVGLAEGQHTLRITADLDGDGRFGPGELVEESFFYKQAHSVWPAVLGTITVFILGILVLVLLAIRRQRRQG